MIIYILKTTACLLIFLAFYKLFLEKENMHTFKRFYLITAIILAFVIPTILFTEYVYIAPQPIATTAISNYTLDEFHTIPEVAQTNELPILLWSLYALGVIVFGFKFCQNLFRIGYRIRKNPKIKEHFITTVLLNEKLTPHTFFNFIFLNKQKFEAQEIPEEVLLHERTHAVQKHSLDVLFIEFLQVILWFNPLVYVFKHSIKLNHEFLADQAVMQEGVETSKYQKILLAFSSNAPETQLANAINYSSIKKRFTVMKKHTSKKAVWLRSLLVLPLFALALYSFSETQVLEVPKQTKTIPIQQEKNPETESLYNSEYSRDEATRTQLSEYNRLAEKYNAQPINQRIIKKVELKKLETIYRAMTSVQKENAQPFPECPPPPKTSQDGATEAQVSEYNSIASKYSDMNMHTIIGKSEIVRMEQLYNLMTEKQKRKVSAYPELPPMPQGQASTKQVNEYNALAKKYNTMNSNNMRIQKSEVARMEYLYSIMTEKQKKGAEAFPELPPMPEPPMPPTAPQVKKGEVSNIPPPPAPPKTIKGKTSNNPPQPPTPKSPLDHIIEMAKKDATFYYEDKKISSDKAIEILKKDKNLNIDTRNSTSKKPVVRISKEPISIEN
tara:strand:- start:1427 stop:3262 length:1836 start_codon:yes stop_codon:yes gene_type:complete